MYEYPFGNGQQLNLDWFLSEWKNLLAAWEAEKNGIEGALQAEIDRAEAALADVFAARDAAAQSATNALESKNAAAQSASDASGYLDSVEQNATAARNAAQNAAQSESNAAESAQTALASKNTAANSERNAAQSEANANSSKNAAAQSASDADASKSAAAQSAADADASKSAAAQSAEDASDAAASVEASAQQIATNASNIDILKNFYPTAILPLTKYATGENAATRMINEVLETIRGISGAFNLTGGSIARYNGVTNMPNEAYNIHLGLNARIKIKIEVLEMQESEGTGWFYYVQIASRNTGAIQATRTLVNFADRTGTVRETYYTITEEADYCLYIYLSSTATTSKVRITLEAVPPTQNTANIATAILNNDAKDTLYEAAEETK